MVAVSAAWRAIGTTCRVLATDPSALHPAVALTAAHLDDLDLAASRFRSDSQLSLITAAARTADLTTTVDPLLGGCLQAALEMAAWTGGLVDPTIGAALVAAGYDADLDEIRARGDHRLAASGETASAAPGWRSVRYDPAARVLSVPRGTVLDLGATAKAYAADRIAQELAAELPGGFLVDLGGDLGTAGEPPGAGWQVGVQDPTGRTRQVVAVQGAGVATSSTQVRTWRSDGRVHHHILDPRTGRPAPVVWAQVTCAADCALVANAASTAAVILGHEAPTWLAERGIPARLERMPVTDLATAWSSCSDPVVLTCGWPPEAVAA